MPDSGDYGVTYSPKSGARCPGCGATKVSAYRHMPWDGATRFRYHKCPNCGRNFRSIEFDVPAVDAGCGAGVEVRAQ